MGKYIRIAVVAVAVSGAVMLPRIVSSREAVRDVTVVVRNMAYYAALAMFHDQGLVATKVLDGKGQDTVTFRVPRASNGSTSYTCTPHTAMMNGAIVIE